MKIIISYLVFLNLVSTQKDDLVIYVESVLDKLHLYASESNSKKYIDLFASNAVFFGTDISERWHKNDFNEYVTKRMESGTGWTYTMKERNLYFSDDKKTAWFDEILISKEYGYFRGTGALKIENNKWKIVQYNLLLPIPNHLLKKYAFEIKDYYKTPNK